MTRDSFCSYKLSMLGNQMIKQYIVQERRRFIRKLWGLFFWAVVFLVLTAACFIEQVVAMLPFEEQLVELAPLFLLFGLLLLLSYFMVLFNGYNKHLGAQSDLKTVKKGGYKVDTIFIVGAYRPRSRGFGSTALKSLLEGHKDYAIGTVSGRSVHALNLTGDLIENAYRPCLELDNGTVYVLPRTAVTAPRNEKKH